MSGATAPWFIEQHFGPDGKPLSGGKVFFWVAGSTVIPKQVYGDIALTEPLEQPLVLDAGGFAPQYFMEPGLYKIQTFNASMTGGAQHTRDNVQASSSGGGGGEDSYQIKIRAGDAAPGYGEQKFGASATITWEVVDLGAGVLQMRPNVDLAAVRDYKVKADGSSGDVPGYLDRKLTDKAGNDFAIDITQGRRVIIPLQDYLSLIVGGHVQGPTIIDNLTVGTFKMPPGSAGMLIIDSDGTVTRQPIPAETGRIRMEAGDIIGYARDKIQPGAGMRIDYTNDPDLGEIMSISMVNVPTPITIPAKRIVLGSGTGVTSYANLTYYNKQLIADAVSIETFYLGAGSYAGFSNAEVRTVPTRNFKDGITQYANGDLRIGADGDAAALKLTAATKVMDTGNDTTLRVGGKLQPPGNEITTTTFTLPVVGAGETKVIRFNGATGCTVTADAAQVPRYRSSANGLSVVGTAGGQIDAASVFGIVAGCKVAAITIVGISATACQVIY